MTPGPDAPGFRIRPATPADEPVVARMLALAFNWRNAAPDAAEIPVDPRYVRSFGRPGDLGVIADAGGGEPAGAAWMRLLTGGERGYGYVADDVPELALAVVPEHRGRGLGSALLAALMERAEGAGVRAVSLSVEPDNPALRIYERAGFTRRGGTGGAWTLLRELAPTLR